MIINTSNELFGKNIMITGGTTGIGRACAVLLSSKGANVFIFGRHEKELNDAIEDINKKGGNAFGCTADVCCEEDIRKVFEEFDDVFGQLDILVNNAGVASRSVLDSNAEEINYVLNVNLRGYLVCSKYAIERMKKSENPQIINIGSLSSVVKDHGADLYVATKSGVEGFSDSLRKSLNEKGIKLTLIRPGSVGTDLINEPIDEQIEMEENNELLMAEDVANAVYYAINQSKRSEIMKVDIKSLKQIL